MKWLKVLEEDWADGRSSPAVTRAEEISRLKSELAYHEAEAHEADLMGSEKWYAYHDQQARRLKRALKATN